MTHSPCRPVVLRIIATAMTVCFALALGGSPANSEDWPQWNGPTRNGRWIEKGVVKAIPADGLVVKWRTPVNLGYSGPAVVGGRVYLTDFRLTEGKLNNNPGSRNKVSGVERTVCLDAKSGEMIWERPYQRQYNISYASGPRATPTVDGKRVFSLGAEGDLQCLDATDGKQLWRKDLKSEYETEAPFWGFSAAPLVDGDKLICIVGGKGSVVVAFDKTSGKELWRALSASDAAYCPPTIINAGGVRQLLIWHADALNGLNPETGEVYWTEKLAPSYKMSIMAPQKEGDYLFASGIGTIGAVFKLNRDKPGLEIVWRGDTRTGVYCANSTPIIDAGVIYGCSCRGGQLRAVELTTGKRFWETFKPTTNDRRAGHGTVMLTKNGDHYYLFNETGDLIIAQLSPKAYREVGRFHVLEPTNEAFGRKVVWSYPAFANRHLFVRNDKEIVCVSLEE
jgi:outer membrane protein assembly factor BamB